MAWLCVNKNGQELIFPDEPTRWGDIRKETKSPFGLLDRQTGRRYTIGPAKEWELKRLKFEELSYWKNEEILGGGEFFINYEIDIPEGYIEKLIGRKLTWEDEPVEIK